MNRKLLAKFLWIMLFLPFSQVFATTYSLPEKEDALIGRPQYQITGHGDLAVAIAKRYDLGFNAIERANPHLYLFMKQRLPSGAFLYVPTQHLLPSQKRQGIVINLPEMRMYYFPSGSNKVITYPIGIGKVGKTIPVTQTHITKKTINPEWIPPEDIREFNLKQGIVLPRVMPAGPDNPLGPYAVYMRLPTYLIHSTIFPDSIGRRASFGCIRMYESDIKSFFHSVQKKAPVTIINSPTKVGWHNAKLYMEVHPPLEEHQNAVDASLPGMVDLILEATKNEPVLVDWQMVSYLAKERDGIPHQIGTRLDAVKPILQ